MVFKPRDYLDKQAQRYKYTLIGKFTNTMPNIEMIEKEFLMQTKLRGGVKLSHLNSKHMYIDLDSEFDHIIM